LCKEKLGGSAKAVATYFAASEDLLAFESGGFCCGRLRGVVTQLVTVVNTVGDEFRPQVVLSHADTFPYLCCCGMVIGVISVGLLGPQKQGGANQQEACSSFLFVRIGCRFDCLGKGGEALCVDRAKASSQETWAVGEGGERYDSGDEAETRK